MNEADLFDQYLVDYQPDLKRIIGKHRLPNHALGEDEVLSEVNSYLLKKKDDIIAYRNEEKEVFKFTHIGFKKAAFAYAKNLIKWTHIRRNNTSYVKRRVDAMHKTEDGEVTTFEWLCDTLGEEDAGFEFDSSNKAKYVLKMIREYSHILTNNEHTLLKLMEEGKNQYQMAGELGVTHQAVSIAVKKLTRKLRNKIRFDYKSDNSYNKVREGREAIESLFTDDGGQKFFSPDDKKDLISFLIANSQKYTFSELVKAFKNGRFTKKQLMGVINFNKLGYHIIKQAPCYSSYTKEEVNLIVKMVNEEKFTDEISEAIGRNNREIGAKCGHLKKIGLIKKLPITKANKDVFGKRTTQKMIKMFKEGLTSFEVAKVLNKNTHSVAGKRASLCKKGLIPISKKTARNRRCVIKKGESSSVG